MRRRRAAGLSKNEQASLFLGPESTSASRRIPRKRTRTRPATGSGPISPNRPRSSWNS